MKKLLYIFGTRPEAIKMAPLIIESEKNGFKPIICLSGQHRDMVKPFMSFFNMKADFDLEVMKPNQNLADLTSSILSGSFKLLDEIKPDMVVVQGDTTTTFAGALAAFYKQIPVAHIEAGLRTFDKYSPFPEEINRQMVSTFATLHFPPTNVTKENLLKEGRTGKLVVTGNTSIDALRIAKNLLNKEEFEKKYSQVNFNKKIILVTTHRRENHGEPLKDICKTLKYLNEKYDAEIVLPVHLNPNVKQVVEAELGGKKGIHLLSPLEYPDFVFFMQKSFFIMTDSGGVQEEGPYFGKPILVLRDNTERPEGVSAGTSLLVGTNFNHVSKIASELIENEEKYLSFKKITNPYGDGHATDKIFNEIKDYLKGN